MNQRAAPTTGDQKAVRFCPRCGYRGNELQGSRGGLVIACPNCREDLYSRPARSYLEMEGFLDPTEYGWMRTQRIHAAIADAEAGTRRASRLRSAISLSVRVALATIVCVGLFLAVSLATVAALSS